MPILPDVCLYSEILLISQESQISFRVKYYKDIIYGYLVLMADNILHCTVIYEQSTHIKHLSNIWNDGHWNFVAHE